MLNATYSAASNSAQPDIAVAADRFQQHIHVFRGVAIIAIVCAHTVPSLNWTNDPMLGRIIDAIANQSSIFFFFIAGYLFQYLSVNFTYQRYLTQKAKTVVLPYLILSIPALIVFTLLTKRVGMWPTFYDLPIWGQVGMFLLTGKHLAPLWFVPTITLFYLLAPLFLLLDRNFRFGYWVILPLIILSTTSGRGGELGPLDKAIYLLPIYLLGMAFCRYRTVALPLVQRWWPLLTLIAILAFTAKILAWNIPPFWQMPLKASLALLITWLLSRHHGIFGNRLNYIAEISFGIFFIHAYFILIVKLAAVYLVTGSVYDGQGGDVIPGTLPIFFAYAGVVLGISVLVIWVVKKLLGRNSRMFIGA
jgi:hypothetical protein